MLIKITIFGLSKFWFLICEVLLSNSIVKSCTYILQSTTYPGLVTKAIGASKGKKRARKLLRPRLGSLCCYRTTALYSSPDVESPQDFLRDSNGLLLWLRRSLFWLRCCFVATFSVIGELAGETPPLCAIIV